MSRAFIHPTLLALVSASSLALGACSAGDAKTKDRETAAVAVAVAPVAATEKPIARFIRVTGTLAQRSDIPAQNENSAGPNGTPHLSERDLAQLEPQPLSLSIRTLFRQNPVFLPDRAF